MKRYYLSPIVGVGTEADPYRPKIADYGVGWVGVIPSDPTTGKPLFSFALVLVEALNHAAILADTTIDALPDFPLDGKVSAVNTGTKNRMVADLQARGLDTSLIGNSDGYPDVIRGIGKALDPGFDENHFDVA